MTKKPASARQRKLRILFTSEYFYPRAAGGEVWSWELCTALAAQGHDVTVITCQHDDSPREEIVRGVRILRPMRTTPDAQRRFARWRCARKLARFIEDYLAAHKASIDVVHTMAYAINVPVSRSAKRHGIPCITSVHSFFGKDWSRLSPLGPLLRSVERNNLRRDESAAIHVPSRFLQERIKEETGRETIVIHNWISGSFPRPKRLPKGTLLFVGSLEKIKDPLACIPVAKRLDAKLLVIGTGSLERRMRDEAMRAGITCEFLGGRPPQETRSHIGGASMVLVPSINESFSLVALEAVAQGTPVSGTAVGVMPELRGVTAFPPSKIPPRLSSSIASVARKHFDHERLSQAVVAAYRSILEDR